MIVLQINAVNGIRSTGRITTELANYLNQEGHEAYIAYSSGIPYIKEYKIGNKIDRKIHGLLSRVTGKQGYFSRNSTKELIEWIKTINPSIIHLHNLHGNFINLPILFEYLSKKDIPTVITLHDCWFYSGGHTHYFKDEYYDWRDGFLKKNRNKNLMGNPSWFFDKSENLYNDQIKWFTSIPRVSFVGVSKWISEESKQSKVTKGLRIETIYNWVDLEVFSPVCDSSLKRNLKIQNKFVILGVASFWTQSKGLDRFIELSNTLEKDECIFLVGKMRDNVDLPRNIINIPETHDITELADYYSMADVFLNLSTEESFGKVSAESLACGTPVITNGSTGNPEILGEGCGYIAETFDDIRDKINQIKIHGKDYYAKSCIEFAHKNFDSKKRMKDYVRLYTSLIESEVKK